MFAFKILNKVTILVTGANGFVGRALCDEAVVRGIVVRTATRRFCDLGIENVVVSDIDTITNWQDALAGVDVVIHLAARVHVMRDDAHSSLIEFRRVNLEGTEHLARSAATKAVKRFVYVSSIKVNGEKTSKSRCYSGQDLPAPQDSYGISKWEAEQALHRVAKETGLEVTIVRPPLVYGARVKGNFIQMMNVIARGLPLPFASVCNHRDLIYVGNLVDALITCATHPNAAGQTYLVSDGESITTPDLIRNLAKTLGSRCLVFPFPVFVIRFLAKLLGKSAAIDRLTQSLRIDDSKIRRELDWQPPYTMGQGLKSTAEWYLAQRQK